ncbi:hypothetical protein [Novosphingobium sp. ES2-1]|uniref:hypothetical protein n=1 Tax=Novosphingobium sp. ES2-1 TaxID=2780074 RepID=UPI00188249E1|nr:hypothetical protein [Novosphingobium sp. ES2-1]QOV95208.1 hypothetical protein IM701_07245 [Novosphingobium sp. ES2-1]
MRRVEGYRPLVDEVTPLGADRPHAVARQENALAHIDQPEVLPRREARLVELGEDEVCVVHGHGHQHRKIAIAPCGLHGSVKGRAAAWEAFGHPVAAHDHGKEAGGQGGQGHGVTAALVRSLPAWSR